MTAKQAALRFALENAWNIHEMEIVKGNESIGLPTWNPNCDQGIVLENICGMVKRLALDKRLKVSLSFALSDYGKSQVVALRLEEKV